MCEHIISVGMDWDKSKEKHSFRSTTRRYGRVREDS
jgi:hypothetical protein